MGEWVAKIADLKEDIDAIREDESVERELRLADIYTGKSENLQKYKQDIHSRPAKQWYMTNNEKRELKSTDAEQRLKASEDAAKAAEEADASAAAGKGKKNKRPYEDPDA